MKKYLKSLYAERGNEMRESEVRALFKTLNSIDAADGNRVISLAGGMPDLSTIRLESIKAIQNKVVNQSINTAFQYGEGQGNLNFREKLADQLLLEGIKTSADDIIITTGSQSALDMVSKVFIDKHDVVLTESPTYVGAIGVFRSYQADVQHVETDEHGMIPEALSKKIAQLRKQNRPIKLLYLVPNYSNPAGTLMSDVRREAVYKIALENNILIIEDNPYGLLYFDSPPPKPIFSRGNDNVIYLGTFSKTFAPGLRTGFVVANHDIKQHIVLANESAVLSPSEFSQMIITEFIEKANWNQHTSKIQKVYKDKRDLMSEALEHHAPMLSFNKPEGGFFIWAELPKKVNSKELLNESIKQGVAFTPGTAFYANGRGENFIRLSFSLVAKDMIEPSIIKISESIRLLHKH
jgi:2-aminoadipate transaminase